MTHCMHGIGDHHGDGDQAGVPVGEALYGEALFGVRVPDQIGDQDIL